MDIYEAKINSDILVSPLSAKILAEYIADQPHPRGVDTGGRSFLKTSEYREAVIEQRQTDQISEH